MKKLFLALLLAVGVVAAQAEVFYGIQFYDNLSSIKKKYPKATYEIMKVSWLDPGEAFIKISGVGIAHELRIFFEDKRVWNVWGYMSIYGIGTNEGPKTQISSDDDNWLSVKWVRVIYNRPIPIDVFSRKYGHSECKIDDDFFESCDFSERAISAQLMPDGKFVHFSDTTFTKQEKVDGFRLRGEKVPDWVLKH